MWDSVRKIISSVAPTLGTAIGGPFGGIAGAMVAKAITGSDNATEDDILSVLTTNPDALLKLKQAEYDFKLKMRDAGVKESELDSEDRASARKRESDLAKAGKVDHTMQILAFLVTFGFFALIFSVLFITIPKDAVVFVKEILFLMGGYFGGIITYYFGSSAGSRNKDLLK